MKWHILGAGSLGSLWAAKLLLAGQQVRLILRPLRYKKFQAIGHCLHFTDLHNTTHTLPAVAETANDATPIGCLILTCKAHAAEEAVNSIRHRLLPGAPVLLLQNGIGSQQAVTALLPNHPLLVGSSTEGAYMTRDFHCVHAGAGETLFGTLQSHPPASALLEHLVCCGIPCQWHPDILSVLWRKLAINSLINPLTVLHDCHNGELMQQLPIIKQLAAELSQLLQAAGYPATANELLAATKQVITATATNTSSMLQDVQYGRRTEISYITGFALQQSRLLNTPHQHLQSLHSALQQRLHQLGLPEH